VKKSQDSNLGIYKIAKKSNPHSQKAEIMGSISWCTN